jgi:hypothetical protein
MSDVKTTQLRLRSAIRLTRDGESHFYVAPSATEIAEFLDYESVYAIGKDPAFDGLFEEHVIADLATMICIGTKWDRVA